MATTGRSGIQRTRLNGRLKAQRDAPKRNGKGNVEGADQATNECLVNVRDADTEEPDARKEEPENARDAKTVPTEAKRRRHERKAEQNRY
jgi:hypothetical protein